MDLLLTLVLLGIIFATWFLLYGPSIQDLIYGTVGTGSEIVQQQATKLVSSAI